MTLHNGTLDASGVIEPGVWCTEYIVLSEPKSSNSPQIMGRSLGKSLVNASDVQTFSDTFNLPFGSFAEE